MIFLRDFLRLCAAARLSLLGLGMALALVFVAPAHAASTYKIAVERASLQADADGGWSLDARFDFSLNNSLSDAVSKGIPLYFTTEFTLTRPRWYWFDQRSVNTSQSVRLSFQPLTREYRISSGGGLYQAVATLDQALAIIRHVATWHVIDPDEVSPGEHYEAAVRMSLDMAQMPKPFQIDAVNNRDWNLSSDWWKFDFNAIEHAK